MNVLRSILAQQFGATAQMLQESMEACPEQVWTKELGGATFWHLAYHTIFFLDFYLHEKEADFVPPPFHREDAWSLSPESDASGSAAPAVEPYSKSMLLQYLQQVRNRAKSILAELTEDDLTAPSPVPWYTIQRGEFLLNNLRHAQHHVGQLNMILRAHGTTPPKWHGASGL